MTGHRFAAHAVAAEVTLAVLASFAGALVYQGFFATAGYLTVLAAACATGGATAVLGHRRTWSTLFLAVAGLALVLVFAVFRGDAPSVLDGLPGSWKRLLTAAVPADPWDELLAVPTVVTWAAAFASVLLVLLTRSALVPLLPPLAGFGFAVFAVGNQAGDHPIATVAFLLTALFLAGLRTHRSTGSRSIRAEGQPRSRSIAALGVVGLVVATSALFGVVGSQVLPLASGEHRFDPRDVLAPQIKSTDTLTPLSQLKSQLTESPPRPLFTVRFESGPSELVDRVRTAALDVFDGTIWTTADTYRVAGGHLTTDPALTRGREVTARIEVTALAAPYLPVFGWPSRLSALGGTEERFGFDPDSGVAVRTSPNSPQLGYDMTGVVSSRETGLSETRTTSRPETALPPKPPGGVLEWVALYQQQYQKFRTPYERLLALEGYFRSRNYQLDRPPGHSYAAINRVLADESSADGYAEQYAAAFAVIARSWGLPARVAVGYRLHDDDNGLYRVSTSDAHAWPEVHFEGFGWVIFEPTRVSNARTPAPPSDAPRVIPPHPAPASDVPAVAPPNASLPSDEADSGGAGWSGVLRDVSLLVPATTALLLLAAGAVVLVKAVRRRNRRGVPGHAAQVLGAWHEQIDRLTERGVALPVSLTCHEVAEHARDRLGDAAGPVVAAAELATTAIYAPDHVDAAAAEQAWRLAGQLHVRLYPRRTSIARLRAAVDPRPLWTAWVRSRQRRQAGEELEVGRYR